VVRKAREWLDIVTEAAGRLAEQADILTDEAFSVLGCMQGIKFREAHDYIKHQMV